MKKVQEIRLSSSGEDMEAVLNEASEFSKSMDLSEKDSIRIRLLTEETMCMVRTLTGEVDLTLSFIGQDDMCIIKVETDTQINALKKDDILSVSKSGKNSEAKGIMGKIRDVFENVFMMPTADFVSPSLMSGMPVESYSSQLMDTVCWTLADYRSEVETAAETIEKREKWDELEKSIVSNIADDVQVGVRGNHVVMSIFYSIK